MENNNKGRYSLTGLYNPSYFHMRADYIFILF
nr:MAG TPA: hypothetical protein [Caudoviricetes sp.]